MTESVSTKFRLDHFFTECNSSCQSL